MQNLRDNKNQADPCIILYKFILYKLISTKVYEYLESVTLLLFRHLVRFKIMTINLRYIVHEHLSQPHLLMSIYDD